MRARTLLFRFGILIVMIAAAGPGVADTEQTGSGQADTTATRSDATIDEQDELDAIRQAAEAESKKESRTEEAAEEKVFKSGNLGLQALNPEISVTGDMTFDYQSGHETMPTTDTKFRSLGLHFEAYLDPYSRFKAAVAATELEEAYFTRYGMLWNMNLTLGKFRQQFGAVNRWHIHALDWFNFPLALTSVFGPEGLNQTGLSLDWSGSTGPIVHGSVLQVTDGTNGRMFGGNSGNLPSLLVRHSFYNDLSASTYLQIGLTGLVGWNDAWATVDTTFNDRRTTAVYGADLVLMWEPTDRMRYRNIEWRSEAYFVDKEIYAPDGSGTDHLRPWGFFSSIYTKLSRTVEVGARYDYFAPETRDYAALSGDLALSPLAVTEADAHRQLGGVWLTWWQSPFVKFRGGYSYEDGRRTGPDVHHATLQMVFAAGPHKHERY